MDIKTTTMHHFYSKARPGELFLFETASCCPLPTCTIAAQCAPDPAPSEACVMESQDAAVAVPRLEWNHFICCPALVCRSQNLVGGFNFIFI